MASCIDDQNFKITTVATPLGRWESPADTLLKIPDFSFRFWLSPPLGFRFACLVPLLALFVCLLACTLSCWGDLGSGFHFRLFACLDLAVLLALCLFCLACSSLSFFFAFFFSISESSLLPGFTTDCDLLSLSRHDRIASYGSVRDPS